MKLTAQIMEHTQAYRLWQMPFANDKFAPVIAHNDMTRVRRVLDVGCGPGTNTERFAGADYLGIDCNEGCIEYARRNHQGNFVVADVTKYRIAPGQGFDFILVNSFLHHVAAADARRILSHLKTLLTDDGHVHLVDLVLPEQPSVARWLARMDRGEFPRPVGEWLDIVTDSFEPVVFEPYSLGALGTVLWSMVYFKGRARK
jgi:2-polyprenyl-3-methyl-5-hydroxy-6-metoxy-1,4-benzoquinol methylase